MKNTILFLFLLALFSTQITAQTKEEKKEQKELNAQNEYDAMKKLVDSKSYEFNAIWISTNGKRINISSGSNNITISQDSTKAAMQYFGTVTSISFSGAEGVIFDNKMEGYNVKFDDLKKKIVVSYTVKNRSETYNIFMTINKTGETYTDVYSNNKRSVTYDGNVTAVKRKK